MCQTVLGGQTSLVFSHLHLFEQQDSFFPSKVFDKETKKKNLFADRIVHQPGLNKTKKKCLMHSANSSVPFRVVHGPFPGRLLCDGVHEEKRFCGNSRDDY